METFAKSGSRIVVLQLATTEMADKIKELTVELHLSVFAVAVAFILGFPVRSWGRSLQKFMRRQSHSEFIGISEFVFD